MLNRKKHVEELMDGAQFFKRRASLLQRSDRTGITGSQWLVIAYISHNEGTTTADAAEALNLTGSAVTQLVNSLVLKGYIKRTQDPKDRRAHRLTLSSASKKRIAEFKKKRIAMMLKMFKILNDKEFAQYCSLNKKIASSLAKA